MASSVIASAFALAALAALAGCAAGPVAWLSRQDADSLPKLEAARTRSDHEEIATWYERQAASDDRQVDVHLRMGDFHASPDPGYSGAEFTGRCRILIFRHQRAAENNRALALLHIRLAGAAHE